MSTPNNNQWSQGPQQSTPGPRRGRQDNYGRIASFNDVFNNLGFTSSLVFKPGVIVYYLAHGLIGGGIYFGLVFGVVMSMGLWGEMQDGSMDAPPEFGAVFILAFLGIFIYLFVWTALGTGPIAAIRKAARGELQAVDDIGATFKHSFRAGLLAIPILFLVNVINVVGLVLLIIPGLLAAFFLTPSVYLVVTGQTGTFESLTASFNLVKKHTGAVGALWVALIGGYVLLFGLNMCLGFIPIVGALISLPVTLAGYAFFFILYMSAMLSIDSAENAWSLGRAHDGIEQVFE